MPRTAGNRGRLPKKPEGERFALKYVHEYAGQPLPAPVYPVDVSGGITDWGMLGNGPDPTLTAPYVPVGDCTFAGRQHLKMAKAAADGESETWETSDELVAEYLAYDDGQDVGANIADLLLAWYKAGVILGFAPVDHTDPAAVDAAMAAFHGVYAGVQLTDDADQLFAEGEPWAVGPGEEPDPDEGHCIVKVAAQGPGDYDTWVTWGALQESTTSWTQACLDEAWAVITSEDAASAVGLDMDALRADIEALGGTGGNPGPEPAPEPAPAPVPAPPGLAEALLRELAGLIRDVAAAPERTIADVIDYLHSHGL